MKDFSDEQIINFYNSDFSQKYNISDDGTKNWNGEFLKNYWLNFYKLIELHHNEINNIIIPRFNWYDSEVLLSKINLDTITFSKCTFLDDVVFEKMKIKSLSFVDCIFKSSLNLMSSQIKSVIINSIVISDNLSLVDCEIGTLLIEKGLYFDDVELNGVKVLEELNLNFLSIRGVLKFKDIIFNSKKESLINNLKKIDKASLSFEDYLMIEEFYIKYEIYLKNRPKNKLFNFSLGRLDRGGFLSYVDEKLKLKDNYEIKKEYFKKKFNYYLHYFYYDSEPEIIFEGSTVVSQLGFYSLNLKNFYFGNSTIEDLKFSNCQWNVTNRLILAEDKINNGDQVENQYRQLKRIFKKEENWYMSSMAYSSEIDVAKRQIGYHIDDNKLRYFSKHSLEYLILQFYGVFGGYTQNFIRPLTVFLISTLVFFPLVYMFFEVNTFNTFSLPESLEKSISNSLPFIKTDLKYESWTLKSFQTLFSTIILTFTILGLRNRFKQ